MKRRSYSSRVILLVFCFASLTFAELRAEEVAEKMTIKSGFGFEFFSRTINWDDNIYTSKLKTYLFSLHTEFEFQEGLSFNLLLGYSTSQYAEMIFRRLPFSVELDVGGIGGYLFGGEIKKSIITVRDFEIDGLGHFVTYLGLNKQWEIPGLNIKGEVVGKPHWMEVAFGPLFVYKGFDYFYPYLSLKFSKLWGKFKMDQTIQELKGSEEKKIQGEGLFAVSGGTTYEIMDNFSIKGEASLFAPFKKGVDFGFSIKAIYSFSSPGRKS